MQGITEVAGEAGCGKTQLCLMLSLQVSILTHYHKPRHQSRISHMCGSQIQLDEVCGGRSGAAAYLSCGEGTFPIRRLSQLATAYEGRTGISCDQYLSNVHIEQCYNIDDAQVILVRLPISR
jgi:RecA/RadA recombinase